MSNKNEQQIVFQYFIMLFNIVILFIFDIFLLA